MVYAGFWIRVLANIIDSVVLFVPLFIINFALQMMSLFTDSEGVIAGVLVVLIFTNIILVALYYTLTTSSRMQGTVGKKLLNLRVIDAEGQRISAGRAFGRFLSYMLSGILYIGYIMVGVTAEKRGLHDYIAGTWVIKN
ncbi:RDD family protein [Sporosarcina oncorhynchi]|uniref:RDD family protein n=1 Tax=Sporosarcina oncorhynchi TaxID=3056444 RepID=A0ABZ0L595_9BACL|nr:RDD family protein [Sporosarcina sp. T2O-4]WOV87359.1 RDD family protein [Sporosarcina sp. T2O-4]